MHYALDSARAASCSTKKINFRCTKLYNMCANLWGVVTKGLRLHIILSAICFTFQHFDNVYINATNLIEITVEVLTTFFFIYF
jgi:hypothetical protein